MTGIEALQLLADAPLDFEPGDRYAYSNGGYFLLSLLVQRASGRSLREFSDERIFRPLGMGDTHFHDDPVHIVPRRAMSYQPLDDGGFLVREIELGHADPLFCISIIAREWC